jgi:hypothetical protein
MSLEEQASQRAMGMSGQLMPGIRPMNMPPPKKTNPLVIGAVVLLALVLLWQANKYYKNMDAPKSGGTGGNPGSAAAAEAAQLEAIKKANEARIAAEAAAIALAAAQSANLPDVSGIGGGGISDTTIIGDTGTPGAGDGVNNATNPFDDPNINVGVLNAVTEYIRLYPEKNFQPADQYVSLYKGDENGFREIFAEIGGTTDFPERPKDMADMTAADNDAYSKVVDAYWKDWNSKPGNSGTDCMKWHFKSMQVNPGTIVEFVAISPSGGETVVCKEMFRNLNDIGGWIDQHPDTGRGKMGLWWPTDSGSDWCFNVHKFAVRIPLVHSRTSCNV